MFQPIAPIRTDYYNRTMQKIGCNKIDNTYCIWQLIARPTRQVDGLKNIGILAGSRRVLHELVARSEDKDKCISFAYLDDGMPFLLGTPVWQSFGHLEYCRMLEPKLLSTIFFMSQVATRANGLVEKLGKERIIDFGMRSQAPGSWSYACEASIIGGIKYIASEAVLDIPYLKAGRDYKLAGTTGHSLYLEYLASGYKQRETFSMILDAFDRQFPDNTCGLLVDTIDAFKGINDALKVIQQVARDRGKLHMIRLDSGDIIAQALYTLTQAEKMGLPLKIIISGNIDEKKALKIDATIKQNGFNPLQSIIYGVGAGLVNNITRDSFGSWAYKPSQFTLKKGQVKDVIKISNSAFKKSLPDLIGINHRDDHAHVSAYNEMASNRVKTQAEHMEYMSMDIDALRAKGQRYLQKIKKQLKNPNFMFMNSDLKNKIEKVETLAKKFI